MNKNYELYFVKTLKRKTLDFDPQCLDNYGGYYQQDRYQKQSDCGTTSRRGGLAYKGLPRNKIFACLKRQKHEWRQILVTLKIRKMTFIEQYNWVVKLMIKLDAFTYLHISNVVLFLHHDTGSSCMTDGVKLVQAITSWQNAFKSYQQNYMENITTTKPITN